MSLLAVRNAMRILTDGRRTFEVWIEDLVLGPGMRKAIVGPSGSGKTTAMDMLALASAPDGCDRLVLQETGRRPVDLLRYSAGRLSRVRARRFGYVLQTSGLLPFLTIGENVALPQRLAGRGDRREIRRLLAALDLDVPLSTMPSELSVGQRQRVAIARALAHHPDFVFADEPTAALDPASAARVMHLLTELAAQRGAAVLVISHNVELMEAHGFEILPVHFTTEQDRSWSFIGERVAA
ncbi:ABC transporter ATP-binding protein [Salinarimonas chemoclinalis]|uniref:ABC transporter ATP-binding protein n=1 Tax=Salinarimonas chemoclinalis TaxID=3241599 RepID=UPI0035569EE4